MRGSCEHLQLLSQNTLAAFSYSAVGLWWILYAAISRTIVGRSYIGIGSKSLLNVGLWLGLPFQMSKVACVNKTSDAEFTNFLGYCQITLTLQLFFPNTVTFPFFSIFRVKHYCFPFLCLVSKPLIIFIFILCICFSEWFLPRMWSPELYRLFDLRSD